MLCDTRALGMRIEPVVLVRAHCNQARHVRDEVHQYYI
jgi:hypothetical protein